MTSEQQLYLETFALYQECGAKFTMDELANRLSISKKTLYELVRSKEDLVQKALLYYFDLVAAEQEAIRANTALNALQKLERLLCVVPRLPLRDYRMRELKKSFPDAYQLLNRWLETGWEKTFSVLDAAKAEGFVEEIDNGLFSKLYAYSMEGLMLERDSMSTADFIEIQRRAVAMLLGGVCTQAGRRQIGSAH
ncbi:MAG TPA: TetR/AcrR family transcriptional regulator [Candidatus Cryosericum sp.]|nr:TetR/AcrR family transcriptional regulator [Candidatus Cryosericum sp.]